MKISVIVPAYNEEECIDRTIKTVRERAGLSVNEVIVVDGGSSDNTEAIAQQTSATVFVSPQKGRAAQMNYGARQATADILYFLHADSVPPQDFDQKIINTVTQKAPAGCFRLAFDHNHWLLQSYAWFTKFDIDAFRFGDQSLFIKREHFFSIDGFREDHLLMEDNEIVRRIKESYAFSIIDDTVTTSARSYQKVGVIKLQLLFVVIYLLYFLGVKQEYLLMLKEKALREG
ncbi:TIGR04283 family arsenosugar biosynthesis glycosyltransferase [Fodinibius halophilus]|uniref:Glycosyltransferase family 2 protein n=1 Tax=Fodinibius halophilus TaxID=1736908 RepID=A0A6M1SXP4_9BACT|nr:TIGR04283 family arsenosugar biosynthesis glycosyltransferase [Fodinibius halophilus]NGP88678.1 glycosyltransferase family 2 protein [Fodinibius halophilus]